MNFNRAQQEYQRLKALYGQGDLTAEEFESACNQELVVRDRFGRIWQIGVSSGKWYCFENGSWIQKEPEAVAGPAAGGETEMPEILQPVQKSTPILNDESPLSDLSRSAEQESLPVPAVKWTAAELLSKARVRGMYSWLILVSIVIALLLVIVVLGALLVREQTFGWNPQTPARVGVGTPTRLPTRTPPAPTATFWATGTMTPTDRPSPVPTRTLTAEPQYLPQVWDQTEAIYFTSRPSVSEDWLAVLESAAAITFEDYNRLRGMKILYPQTFVIFPSGAEIAKQADDAAVQQEMVFAFPQPQSNASLTLMCRSQDGQNGYSLRVTPFQWRLFKTVEGIETNLAGSSTNLTLQQGNWATIRMACWGNQFTVWDETGLITTVEDSSLSEGRAAVRFENDSPESTGEIAVYFYRLLRLE